MSLETFGQSTVNSKMSKMLRTQRLDQNFETEISYSGVFNIVYTVPCTSWRANYDMRNFMPEIVCAKYNLFVNATNYYKQYSKTSNFGTIELGFMLVYCSCFIIIIDMIWWAEFTSSSDYINFSLKLYLFNVLICLFVYLFALIFTGLPKEIFKGKYTGHVFF